jgi:nucleoside-diphosphate-sugar epimerase
VNILIIGGTRFVGRYTALALHQLGHRVTVFTRGKLEIDLPDDIHHIKGDRKNTADLEGAASHDSWDVVWDNMSYTAEDARSAVRVFDGRCGLFIHTSTLAVYSVCDGIFSPYAEEDFGRGRPLEELRDRYPYDYGIQRREGEQVLQGAHDANGFPFVSVRLPAVIGPRDYSLRAWAYWRRILEDGRIILPDGGLETHRAVFSGDVVSAITAVIERGAEISGRAYNLGGREIVSLRRFVEHSARVLGVDAEILDIPSSVLRAAGLDPEGVSPYTPWANHLHSIARAQHELRFRPTPMEDWLAPTLEWHLEHRRNADPPGWELRTAELELAQRWRSFVSDLG